MRNDGIERSIIATLANTSARDPRRAAEALADLALQPSDFADRAHADVFALVAERVRAGRAVDLATATGPLGASQAVGQKPKAWLAELLMDPATARRPELLERAKHLRHLAQRRRALDLARSLALAAQDPDADLSEALEAHADGLRALGSSSVHVRSLEGDVVATLAELEAAGRDGTGLAIPTGITELDRYIGGLQPGVVTGIGALPGVGKSALLATILDNLTLRGIPVGLLSLEDHARWLVRRVLSSRGGVSVFAMGTRPLSGSELGQLDGAGRAVYEQLRNLHVDDREALTPAQVAESAREMIRRRGCRAVMLDHLGEVELEQSERMDLELRRALVVLRDVAKSEHIPIVVAAHLKRRLGLGVHDVPELTDFAGGSACERMTRVALGLSKPKGDNRTLRVTVLKQTNGPSGSSFELELGLSSAMVQ